MCEMGRDYSEAEDLERHAILLRLCLVVTVWMRQHRTRLIFFFKYVCVCVLQCYLNTDIWLMFLNTTSSNCGALKKYCVITRDCFLNPFPNPFPSPNTLTPAPILTLTAAFSLSSRFFTATERRGFVSIGVKVQSGSGLR